MRQLLGIRRIYRHMKIAFVYGSLTGGGAERVISNLANRLSETHDVSIIIFTEEDSVYRLNENIKLISPVKLQKGKSIIYRIVGFLNRSRFLQENIKSYDCVISFDNLLATQCKLVSPKTKVIGSERANPFFAKKFKEKLTIKLSCILDGFIFQTRGASMCYPKGIRNKSCIIPNAFWGKDIILPKYKDRDNCICASGRITAVKRYDLIIKAFKTVRKKYPEYLLKIYGVGDKEGEIRQLIEEYGLSDAVCLMGWSKDIISNLLRNKIFILASDYEGMPNGLIEAMACGCTCISRNCKFGPAEIIDNEKDGLLIDSAEENDFAAALIKVIEDETLAEEMSINAYKKIKNKFNEQIIINMFCDYIDDVIKR